MEFREGDLVEYRAFLPDYDPTNPKIGRVTCVFPDKEEVIVHWELAKDTDTNGVKVASALYHISELAPTSRPGADGLTDFGRKLIKP
jgi:hypothetical protein